MRTSKPISTISYNTQDFLLARLNELISNRKISDYMFINHFAESDEAKNHIHLWIKPNTLLDTMEIQKFFIELDPQNPLKPLKCIDFKPSSIDDWILYCQHFEPYLASKFESREFHYLKDDFVFYDEFTFEDNYNHAFRGSDWARKNQILQQLANDSINPVDLILNGAIPLNLASAVRSLEYLRTHPVNSLDRNNRPGHPDPDTGQCEQRSN